jgi:hypothetical protein
MADLEHHRHELQVSQDEILRLRQLVSSKDSVIKDLRASKRSVVQELEAARLATKVAEDNSIILKAQRDKAMDKAIRAGRILMRRPGVIVPDDIVADVILTPQVALLHRLLLRKTLPSRNTEYIHEPYVYVINVPEYYVRTCSWY